MRRNSYEGEIMELIDITGGIFSSEVYPGDPEPQKQVFSSMKDGAQNNLSGFFACAHAGTHADSPLHFIEDGKSIDELPLTAFLGPCKVIEVPEGPITGEYVENNFPRGCKRLLIKGDKKAYFTDHGAYSAVNLEYILIGTDALSIGTSGAQIAPHKAFLAPEIAVLEGLDLSNVTSGNYFLIALPLKLEGFEAAPVRAVLIKDDFAWKS